MKRKTRSIKGKRPLRAVIACISVLSIVSCADTYARNQENDLRRQQNNPPLILNHAGDSIPRDGVSRPLTSENEALTYSLMGTLIPTATVIFAVPGIIVGPSTGYFYAGMPRRAWTGIGIRLAGVGGMISSFAICGWNCGPGDSAAKVAWAVFISSAGATAISAAYDIATVKTATRKHNNSLMKLSEKIAPTYFADYKALGLKMQIRF